MFIEKIKLKKKLEEEKFENENLSSKESPLKFYKKKIDKIIFVN